MRGGYLHNMMINDLARRFVDCGFIVQTEVQVNCNGAHGYIDLVARRDRHCIAVEAELSVDRIANDLNKAGSLRATELWIVVPSCAAAHAAQRRLHVVLVGTVAERIVVLTFGEARQRVAALFS